MYAYLHIKYVYELAKIFVCVYMYMDTYILFFV